MIVVGLTGGIGSGKTTVARMFKKLGVPVYDSDKQAKRLMKSSAHIKEAVISLLGADSYNGIEINRKYIANKIFNNKDLLQKLNDIVHPEVRKNFLAWCKRQHCPYVIQEVAIIFENRSHEFYDKIILVTAPQTKRIERVIERDKVNKRNVLARMANQLEDSAKIPLADFVIENIDLDQTRLQIMDIHKRLLEYT
jgi:dephospho-CoA kinase